MPPPEKTIRPRRRAFKQSLAKRLRREATDAEKRLWSRIRNKQMSGVKFRRQHPIGPYVVDFYCSGAKLVIELDGSQHYEDRGLQCDEARSRWLSERGYRVLRFSNLEVFKNLRGVTEGIWHALEASGMPLPEAVPARCAASASTLPQGEGEPTA